MEYIHLNNGIDMPQVGLGTFQLPKDKINSIIGKAYEFGYRKFDTAYLYGNERNIANALKANGIKREDIFITTKLTGTAQYFHPIKRIPFRIKYRSLKKCVETSMNNLNTDYVDLFLIHSASVDYLEMYKVLSDFYREGRIRAIGVCNCLSQHIKSLKEVSDIVPAVNQIEISPLNTQKKLIQECFDMGIAVEAMSTFSHARSSVPRLEIMNNKLIEDIAAKYGKSTVQIVLRWLVQQGISVIPKTKSINHLKDNISLFDFSLSMDDMKAIDSMDKGEFLNYSPYLTIKNIPEKYR